MRTTVDPKKLYISTCSPLTKNPLDDCIGRLIEERTRALEEQYMADILRYSASDVIGTCDILPVDVVKKFFEKEKETEKMEAKKCDRCGKLYEMPRANGSGAKVRFKFSTVYCSEDKSEAKIIEEQTRDIYVKCGCMGDGFVDLCPECRASLKKWFEEA